MLDNVLPLLDTVLLDIKHVENSKHYEYVQQSNSLILENAPADCRAGGADDHSRSRRSGLQRHHP
ncbi:hypothetical protein HMSSN036_63720 [Paenibacillus macerans]|nr:hypothetical protein HMSSN036_63720 [Paenibacillus macerans]